MMHEVDVSTEDDDEEGNDSEEIDLSWVVTVGADFPAHCYVLPRETMLGCVRSSAQCEFEMKALQQGLAVS